jgi:hypothetical protein
MNLEPNPSEVYLAASFLSIVLPVDMDVDVNS